MLLRLFLFKWFQNSKNSKGSKWKMWVELFNYLVRSIFRLWDAVGCVVSANYEINHQVC